MKKQIYNFNLIEIILTVAVVAFGVVVILGMLPKGLKAAKAAGFESYSSEIVDQMGGYLQLKGAGNIESEELAPMNLSTDNGITESYALLVKYLAPSENLPSSLAAIYTKTNVAGVFKFIPGSETQADQKDLYVIVMGNSYDDGEEEVRRIDFSGMLRVWKINNSPYYRAAVKHNHTWGDTGSCLENKCGNTSDASENFEVKKCYLNGATVFMELSYPLSLPYTERTKRYYSFDVDEGE